MPPKDSGLIRLILLIVIVVLALSYFGISLRDITSSPVGQDNFSFLQETLSDIWGWLKMVWNDYLASWVLPIWDSFFLPYVIDPIRDFLHIN